MRTPPIRSDPGKCRSASSLGLIGAGKSQQQGGKHRRRRTRGGAYRTVPDVCSVLFRIHFHRAYLCHYYELLYHHFVWNQAFLPKKTRFHFDQRRHRGAADRFTSDLRRAVPPELHALFRCGRGVRPAGGFQYTWIHSVRLPTGIMEEDTAKSIIRELGKIILRRLHRPMRRIAGTISNSGLNFRT